MKKILSTMFLVILSVVAYSQEFIIIHTNDHHGCPITYEIGGGYVGGLAERSSMIKKLLGNEENYLILDAGDINTGRPESQVFYAEPDIVGYNLIGYQAMAVGNHEFYNGLAILKEQMELADFPFLSANVLSKTGDFFFTPYIIKELKNGLKVGIVGLTTLSTLRSAPNEVLEVLDFVDPIESILNILPKVRLQADIVIALVHLGIDPEGKFGSVQVAKEVDGIDLIIDGHSHTFIEEPLYVDSPSGRAVPILQAGARGMFLGYTQLDFQEEGLFIKSWEPISMFWEEQEEALPADEEILASLSRYEDEVEILLNELIGENKRHLGSEDIRSKLVPLGRLVSDSMLNYDYHPAPDLAFTNGGGIRADLAEGPVYRYDSFQILPFFNTLIYLDIKGEDLLEVIKTSYNNMGRGGFLQYSSNVEIVFTEEQELEIYISGKIISLDRTYKVVTNSYLSEGRDGYEILASNETKDVTGVTIREAFETYLASKLEKR